MAAQALARDEAEAERLRRQQERLREAALALQRQLLQQSQAAGHPQPAHLRRPPWNRHVAPRVERSGKLTLFHRAKPDRRPASVAYPRPGEQVYQLPAAGGGGWCGASGTPDSAVVALPSPTAAEEIDAQAAAPGSTPAAALGAPAPAAAGAQAHACAPAGDAGAAPAPDAARAAVGAARPPAPSAAAKSVGVDGSATRWRYCDAAGLAGVADGARLHLLAVQRLAPDHYVFAPTGPRFLLASRRAAEGADGEASAVAPSTTLDPGAGVICDEDSVDAAVRSLHAAFPHTVLREMPHASYGPHYAGVVDTSLRRVRTVLVCNGSVLDASRPIGDQCRERSFCKVTRGMTQPHWHAPPEAEGPRRIRAGHAARARAAVAAPPRHRLAPAVQSASCGTPLHTSVQPAAATRATTPSWGHPSAAVSQALLQTQPQRVLVRNAAMAHSRSAPVLRRPASAPLPQSKPH